MIRGVIFDLGDTLVTQDPLIGEGSNLDGAAAILPLIGEYTDGGPSLDELAAAIGEKMQRAITEAYEATCAQPDAEALFRDVMDELQCRLPEEHVDRVLDIYFGRAYERMMPLADVIETLTLAKRLSLHLGILANVLWGPEMLRDRLRRLGIAQLMNCVVFSCEIGWMKPYPGAYREMLGRMDLRASEVVMVGDDYSVDVMGARRAGLRAIWKQPDSKRMLSRENQPDHIISDIRQLLPALGELM